MDRITRYLQSLARLLRGIQPEVIRTISGILLTAMNRERQVFIFGNGGSAATASHFAVDLGKGLRVTSGRGLRAHSLVDGIPTLTAWANDTDYRRVFSEQLANLVNPGDVAIAISGSGNSPNVLEGVVAGGQRGAITIGLTGYTGGKLKNLVDLCVIVPSDNMQLIEDVHMALAHVIYTEMREELSSKAALQRSGRRRKMPVSVIPKSLGGH